MPILNEEDSDFLEDLLHNLVAEYAPQTPTEVLLVQEVAVGWFRLNKVWDAEAAAVNKARLEAELAHSFPTTSVRADSLLENIGRPKQEKAAIELLQKGISCTAKVAALLSDVLPIETLRSPKPAAALPPIMLLQFVKFAQTNETWQSATEGGYLYYGKHSAIACPAKFWKCARCFKFIFARFYQL